MSILTFALENEKWKMHSVQNTFHNSRMPNQTLRCFCKMHYVPRKAFSFLSRDAKYNRWHMNVNRHVERYVHIYFPLVRFYTLRINFFTQQSRILNEESLNLSKSRIKHDHHTRNLIGEKMHMLEQLCH